MFENLRKNDNTCFASALGQWCHCHRCISVKDTRCWGVTIASMYCLSVFSYKAFSSKSLSKAQLVSRSLRQNVALRTGIRFTMYISCCVPCSVNADRFLNAQIYLETGIKCRICYKNTVTFNNPLVAKFAIVVLCHMAHHVITFL